MKPLYILALIFMLISTSAVSQNTLLGGTYSIGIPSAGIENYISAGSFRGANFEGVKEINSGFSAGWILGWNVFSEKRINEVYTSDNLTITGTQYRYMNLFPMIARGLWQFGMREGARPFIGSGLGVIADIAKTNIGLYSFRKNSWHFTVAPEIGIKIPLDNNFITGSLRYSYGFKTKEIDRISYFSLNLGMLWGRKQTF